MTEPAIVTEGLSFPEGPVACADGSVILGEIRNGRITRVASDGAQTLVADVGGGPNGLAVGADGAMYVCNNGGFQWTDLGGMSLPIGPHGATQPEDYTSGSIQRVDVTTGAVTTLYTECDGNRLNGPNDIVVDAEGGLWFTDHGKVRERERDRGYVYWCKPDGSEIREVAADLDAPNGIGLSPDGARLYVAETPTARLFVFDIAGAGELVRSTPFGHGGVCIGAGTTEQRFDSLAVEANGNIAVATLISDPGITVFSPDGDVVEWVSMPDILPTNICFGGPERTTAYVTLSALGRLAMVEWARPGLELSFS